MLNGSDQNIPLPPSVLNQRFTPIIMKLTIVLSDEEPVLITDDRITMPKLLKDYSGL
jgi:hypothetical protein